MVSVWGLMGAPGICSEPNGAPGFAQPNGGFQFSQTFHSLTCVTRCAITASEKAPNS
jgi:hypothetical protein